MTTRFFMAAGLTFVAFAHADTAVNPDAALVQDFEQRVAAYMKLQNSLQSQLPRLKSTQSPLEIRRHQNELGNAIRDARKTAKQGDIFTPAIGAEFRRLVRLAMEGKNTARVERSLRSAEPVRLPLKVNDAYPPGIARQSTPPTLLMNLPSLPPELSFRIDGRELVLLDTKANLVVDLMPDVMPGVRK